MAQWRGRLNGAIDALNKLDQVKKSLFYGRDNNLITEGQGDVGELPARVHSDSATAVDIIHAILGMATEAGELLELLKNTINGDEFDWVNLKEELGDSDWYKALLANRGDFEFEEVDEIIIKKLVARYPDKFTAELAVNRDLDTERAVLEGMQDEGDLLMQPTPPASGPEAVKAVEEKSDAAFNKLDNIKSDAVEAPTGTNSELAKPRGYRESPLDDEHIARQPIRREDS
jgi:NTP pyrophosphatase (non-canonical NTP hydrolase)